MCFLSGRGYFKSQMQQKRVIVFIENSWAEWPQENFQLVYIQTSSNLNISYERTFTLNIYVASVLSMKKIK